MSANMSSTPVAGAAARWRSAEGLRALVPILAALTLVRIVLLLVSAMNLQVDEAQYWDWSRHLAFGYYSKPPLIAWAIAAASSVCGSAEACIRLPSPLFYFATPLVIYAIAHALFDRRVAFWTALGFAVAPGVSFSSQIMSTDVLLLFFWPVALYAFVRLRAGGGWRWSVLLGVALGLGLLAKYAMAYFIACSLIAALVDADSRRVVRSRYFWGAVLIGFLLLAPNLAWNIGNNFITFRHTGENVSGGGPHFRPGGGLGFFAAQFGVIGPILFGGMLAAAYAAWRRGSPANDRMLLAFSLPVILVVTFAAFFNGGNANWGASALVATAIVATAFLVRTGRERLLELGVVIGLVTQALIFAGAPLAPRINLPFIKHGDVYNQVVGWRDLADQVRAHANAAGTPTIVTTARNEIATLNYYLRDDPLSVLVWPDDPSPDDHFELTRSVVDHPPSGPALILSSCADAKHLQPFFTEVTSEGPLSVASGPKSARRYWLFRVNGIHAPLQTVPLCDHDTD